jgi:hypothetical protein
MKAALRLILACAAFLLALPACALASGTVGFRATTYQAPEIEGKTTVTIDREGSVDTASVTISSLDGSAKAPADYPAVLDLLNFGPGETTKTVEIPVVDDGARESNETFTLKLSNPDDTTFLSANAIATVVIIDSPGKVSFDRGDYRVTEGKTAEVTVLRSQGSSGRLTVGWSAGAGTAGASDFTPANGTLTWEDGDVTARKLTIPIKQDTAIESPETINLTLTPDTSLSGPLVSPSFSDRANAVLTVDDDDTPEINRLKGGDLFSLTSAKKCVRHGRGLTLKPRTRHDVVITRVIVRVAGKRVRVASTPKSIARKVVLRRLPASGSFAVSADALTSTGRTIRLARTYRACKR